jgi:hypothetical protein
VSGQVCKIEDCYISTGLNSQRYAGPNSVAGLGTYILARNNIRSSRAIYAPGANSAVCLSSFNDIAPTELIGTTYFYTDVTTTNFATLTSDSDYIAGMSGAMPYNVDTTVGTSSTSSPRQYKNLTATRTHAKDTRNKPLSMDNVQIGTPTATSVTITFDCANGVDASWGSTTVDQDSASSGTTLYVASTGGLEVGEVVEIGFGTARFEVARIASISAGDHIVLETALAYSHTAAQADTVKKELRNWALPFIKYGTSTGHLHNSTPIPDRQYFGLIYTGIKTTFSCGNVYEFKKLGHSITLQNLLPRTTYYISACGVTPLDEMFCATSEYTFTTQAVPTGSVSSWIC